MQLNVEPVSTKHYIVLFQLAALVELVFKVNDEKIVSNILSFVVESFSFDDDLFCFNCCSF